MTDLDPDLSATDVSWHLDPLLDGSDVDGLLDHADRLAAGLEQVRGRVAALSVDELVAHMRASEELGDRLGRAGNYASLRFSVDTSDEARGALMQRFQERATAIATRDRFSSLVTLGVAITFFLFFAVNMSMVMGLAPVVGVPLPMVSYGGSAMLVLMAAFGLVQSAHIHRPRGRTR